MTWGWVTDPPLNNSSLNLSDEVEVEGTVDVVTEVAIVILGGNNDVVFAAVVTDGRSGDAVASIGGDGGGGDGNDDGEDDGNFDGNANVDDVDDDDDGISASGICMLLLSRC